MSTQHANIDAITPTRGLIDLADHSKGEGPLLQGYELDTIFDDIILAVYVDVDDTGATIQIILLLFTLTCFPQQTVVKLEKTAFSEFDLDGILSDEELQNAKVIDVIYEHEPGYNTSPSYETITYLTYTDTFLYIGFKAYRDEVKADIHPRDNRSLFEDDFANIHLDTYGDARNNIGLTANLYGSQADGIRTDSNDYRSGSSSGWSLDANFDFQSLGRYTDFGYEVEFIIPFSSIPFPNGVNQEWKIKLSTNYRDNKKQGVTARVYSSKLDRENSCQLCQNNHTTQISYTL